MFADARAREETRNRWATRRETMDLTIGLSVEIDPVSHSHPGVQQVAKSCSGGAGSEQIILALWSMECQPPSRVAPLTTAAGLPASELSGLSRAVGQREPNTTSSGCKARA